MSYIEIKTIKGHQYAYLRESIRIGNKVKHPNLLYLGAVSPSRTEGIPSVHMSITRERAPRLSVYRDTSTTERRERVKERKPRRILLDGGFKVSPEGEITKEPTVIIKKKKIVKKKKEDEEEEEEIKKETQEVE